MRKMILLILVSLAITSGCAGAITANEDTINHYEVAKSMIKENQSKEMIDAYMLDHIASMDIREIDDIVLNLLERMQSYDEETVRVYFRKAIQTQLLERYDSTTGTFDMDNLNPELEFLKTSMDYGLVINESNNFITTDVTKESFEMYGKYISSDLQLYLEITLSIINYGSGGKEKSEKYLEYINTTSKIEQLLINDKAYRFNRERLISNMVVANFNLAYAIPNGIQNLHNSYTSKEKLDPEIINLYEIVLEKYNNTLGLEDTVNYIKRLKENGYVIDDESNAYIEEIQSLMYRHQFTESYSDKLKSKFDVYINKSNATYDMLQKMLDGDVIMEELLVNIIESKEELTPELFDRIILEYANVLTYTAVYYNDLLYEDSTYQNVLIDLNENGTDNLSVLKDATVQFVKEARADGYKIVKGDESVYCVPDPKYLSRLEPLASENISAVIKILNEYSNYRILKGSIEDKIVYQYQLMNHIEEVLLSYEFDKDTIDNLCGLQYLCMRELLYESLLSDDMYQSYLTGDGKIPTSLYNIYNFENKKYPDRFFTFVISYYIDEIAANNYNHTKETIGFLDEFVDYSSFHSYVDFCREEIEKKKYMY